jgi:RimJ/RimL family protein N-acetyltransferase
MNAIFETDRLIVRPWTPDDLQDAYAMYGDPEVTRYLPDRLQHTSLDETRAWLDDMLEKQDPGNPLGFWAAVERSSGRVIGGAVLIHAPINGGNPVEIGYNFARDAWGKGYATEVARALLRHGFKRANLANIVAVIVPDNHASRRVLEKIGMRAEGMGDYNGHPVEVFSIDKPFQETNDAEVS